VCPTNNLCIGNRTIRVLLVWFWKRFFVILRTRCLASGFLLRNSPLRGSDILAYESLALGICSAKSSEPFLKLYLLKKVSPDLSVASLMPRFKFGWKNTALRPSLWEHYHALGMTAACLNTTGCRPGLDLGRHTGKDTRKQPKSQLLGPRSSLGRHASSLGRR